MDLDLENAILKKTKEILLTNRAWKLIWPPKVENCQRLILDNKIISGTPLIPSSLSYITIHASR